MSSRLFRQARCEHLQQRCTPHVIEQLQSDLLLIMVVLLAANLALAV